MRLLELRSVRGLMMAASLLTAGRGAQQPPAAQQPEDRLRPSYVLGAGDQILIRAFEAEEIGEKPYRLDSDGNITLPLLGTLRVAGLTVEKLELELMTRLKAFVRTPQVTVTVVQFRSEPVFLVGAFRTPGIYALQGRRTLVEMLASVGGLQPNASRRIKVTRRKEFGPLPLPNATDDAEGKITSAEISMASLRENINPAEDIVLQPFDVISVDRAEMVYVNGEVGKVGGFELGERDSISITQLIAIAGGLGREAAPHRARILRPVLNTSRRAEIPIHLGRILEGRANDFPLLPNDVLYVPRSSRRAFWRGVAYAAIPMVPTILYIIYR